MIARRLTISGRVQGVGYREWAARTARSLGLDGWVRNRRDGRVEAVVSGAAGAVEQFIQACRRGPAVARVDGLEAFDEDAAAPQGFAILPTL